MKIRWGTAVGLSFGLFIAFMGYMVFQIFKSPELQHEMVTPNYYQKEQSLNTLIQAKKNALQWQQGLKHSVEDTSLLLGPLPILQVFLVEGYCPSNASRDFTLETETAHQAYIKIPIYHFGNQHWEVSLQWQRNDSLFHINYPIRL